MFPTSQLLTPDPVWQMSPLGALSTTRGTTVTPAPPLGKATAMIPAASHIHGIPRRFLLRRVSSQSSPPTWNWLALQQCFQVTVSFHAPIPVPNLPRKGVEPNPELLAGCVTLDKSPPLSGPSFPHLSSFRLGSPESSGTGSSGSSCAAWLLAESN